MVLSQKQLKEFVRQCTLLGQVNFPDVAKAINLRWRDIKPYLDQQWFREEMEEHLEGVKFALVSKLHEAAIKGALPGKAPPPAAHIKEMIKLIDSGVLLGAKAETPEGASLSVEEEELLRKRLGINNANTSEPQDN